MRQDPMVRHEIPSRVSRLVVAPHAGDEVTGCGGLLAKHHDDVAVVVVVEPGPRRQVQLRTAHRMLGTPAPTVLGVPDAPLTGRADLITDALTALITRLRPDELYLPYPSLHHDHLVTYEAGMRATRASVTTQGSAALSVLAYDGARARGGDRLADVHWGIEEPLSEEDVDRSVAAALAYRSPVAHDLRRRAEDAGSAAGLRWAERFALVRTAPGPGRGTAAPAMVGGAR
jgi:LmbE family N-acetylglucosaminyl deacetylase